MRASIFATWLDNSSGVDLAHSSTKVLPEATEDLVLEWRQSERDQLAGERVGASGQGWAV
jgi:hypothetical protein